MKGQGRGKATMHDIPKPTNDAGGQHRSSVSLAALPSKGLLALAAGRGTTGSLVKGPRQRRKASGWC